MIIRPCFSSFITAKLAVKASSGSPRRIKVSASVLRLGVKVCAVVAPLSSTCTGLVKSTRRVSNSTVAATTLLSRTEGIIPALESAHAIAEVVKRAPRMKKSDVVIVNVSGRGDKDIGILRENLQLEAKS